MLKRGEEANRVVGKIFKKLSDKHSSWKGLTQKISEMDSLLQLLLSGENSFTKWLMTLLNEVM